MATLPLDLDGVVGELADGDGLDGVAAPETRIGHVHLRVADLGEAEAFYGGVLGFDVTVRSYPGALFVSAGGYHHHVGLNTWTGPGAPAPPTGSRGLRRFEVLLPVGEEVRRVAERLAGARWAFEHTDAGLLTPDPSGNRVRLGVAPSAL